MARKNTGIRRRRAGWRAEVRVRGKLYTKQFPIETSVEAMRMWREATIREQGGRARDVLHQQRVDAQRLKRSDDTWCYVYVVRSGSTIKIGRSLDPNARLRELQTTHAGVLELIAAVPAHATLEGAIHRRFAHLRTRDSGEWFHLEPDLVEFIRAMQSGANPVALLFNEPTCHAN